VRADPALLLPDECNPGRDRVPRRAHRARSSTSDRPEAAVIRPTGSSAAGSRSPADGLRSPRSAAAPALRHGDLALIVAWGASSTCVTSGDVGRRTSEIARAPGGRQTERGRSRQPLLAFAPRSRCRSRITSAPMSRGIVPARGRAWCQPQDRPAMVFPSPTRWGTSTGRTVRLDRRLHDLPLGSESSRAVGVSTEGARSAPTLAGVALLRTSCHGPTSLHTSASGKQKVCDLRVEYDTDARAVSRQDVCRCSTSRTSCRIC
jgi:hypothetical protein